MSAGCTLLESEEAATSAVVVEAGVSAGCTLLESDVVPIMLDLTSGLA